MSAIIHLEPHTLLFDVERLRPCVGAVLTSMFHAGRVQTTRQFRLAGNYCGRSSLSGRLGQTQPVLVVLLQLLWN